MKKCFVGAMGWMPTGRQPVRSFAGHPRGASIRVERGRGADRIFPCHPRPRRAHFPFEMTVCGWCHDEMHPRGSGAPQATRGVSHGLCPACLDAAVARATARPPQAPVGASRPGTPPSTALRPPVYARA